MCPWLMLMRTNGRFNVSMAHALRLDWLTDVSHGHMNGFTESNLMSYGHMSTCEAPTHGNLAEAARPMLGII
jgi:hypothetical protein